MRTYEVTSSFGRRDIEAESWDIVDGYLCFFTREPRVNVALYKDWQCVLLLPDDEDEDEDAIHGSEEGFIKAINETSGINYDFCGMCDK